VPAGHPAATLLLVPLRPPVSATVVICAYTEQRWDDLIAAVTSVRTQEHPAWEVVIVIDDNHALLMRAQDRFADEIVVANQQATGLSGARNTGVATATGDIVVFLDDDAAAEPGWLAALLAPYDDPAVMGVGGTAHPRWASERPDWFPVEFDWVVGCSYRGLPAGASTPVRNFIGANMSFRRELFAEVGGFTTGVGRTANAPLGCEETEFSIRVRQQVPGGLLLHVPEASVRHRVSPDRATMAYFVRRCFAEGLSKASVAASVGSSDATSAERSYVTRTLPSGFARGLLSSLVIVIGLFVTSAAYGLGRVGLGRPALRLVQRRSTAGPRALPSRVRTRG
jgi:glucosyl-dolichyl phosphate glucuronosyltransferase